MQLKEIRFVVKIGFNGYGWFDYRRRPKIKSKSFDFSQERKIKKFFSLWQTWEAMSVDYTTLPRSS